MAIDLSGIIFQTMTTEEAIDGKLKLTLISAVGLFALYVVIGFLPENGWWGINHLYFFSGIVRILYPALAIAAVLSLLTRPMRRFIEGPVMDPPRSVIYLQPLFWTVLFILLRVAVYSLGDGYQRASEIESGFIFKSTEMLDFGFHAFLYKILTIFGPFRATTAMAATSIAAGTIFVYLLWRSDLFTDGRKSLFAYAILSFGASQLFFGYVESYTLVYLFAFWYILLAFRSPKSSAGLWPLSIIYLLAGFSHVIGLLLLPSYILLVGHRLASRSKRTVGLILFFLLSLTPLIIPQLLAHFVIADDVRPLSEYFIPFFSGPYTVFSLKHLSDILNEFLLVTPILIMFLPFSRMVFRPNPHRRLMLSIIVPSFGFLLLINPQLSMVRDWDLFALPTTLIAVSFLIPAFKSVNITTPGRAVRITSVILLSLFITFSWTLLNSDRTSNLRRSEYALKHAVQGQKYGYELLAYYYSTHHDYENELRTLQSISPLERTAPIYGKISQALYLLNRYDDAYNYAQIGARMPDPDRLNAIMAGLTAFEQKQYPEAAYYLRIAADLTKDPQWLCKLGETYIELDSLDTAEATYSRAMNQAPDLACAFFGLAELYYRKSDYDRAAQYCREGLRRDPGSQTGQALWNKISPHQ